MNLDHDFVQVWKFSEDQKKISKWNTFSPNSGVDQKKRSSARIEHFFPQIYTIRFTPIQIIGGDADVDHSQTIGRMQPNYWGDISPHPPLVSAPLLKVIQRESARSSNLVC